MPRAEDLLAEIVNAKSFVTARDAVSRRGYIDAKYRFQDLDAPGAESKPAAPRPKGGAGNAALFHGPETKTGLAPLVVFVPDSTSTGAGTCR